MKDKLNSKLLERNDSVLVLVDIQEKLVPVMHNRNVIVENLVKLAKFAGIIKLPVILTEQQNLGPTIDEISEEISNTDPISKMEFNAMKCPQFIQHLEQISCSSVILAGIEAHICISQTCLDMLSRFNVHVVSDAVSSRSPHNCDIALQRMLHSGAVISSTEMVIYELLEKAGTDEFRETLRLVK